MTAPAPVEPVQMRYAPRRGGIGNADPGAERRYLAQLIGAACPRVHEFPTDLPVPPCAVILLPRYDPSNSRGGTRSLCGTGDLWEWTVQVTVGRYDDTARTAADLVELAVGVIDALEQAEPSVAVLSAEGGQIPTSAGDWPAYAIRTRIYL